VAQLEHPRKEGVLVGAQRAGVDRIARREVGDESHLALRVVDDRLEDRQRIPE
jgi:hypothetical protein